MLSCHAAAGVRRAEKVQLQKFAAVDAPKSRTAYALYLQDQYPQHNNAALTNRDRIALISRSWKVLAPDVKERYRQRSQEECRQRHAHIQTKISQLSAPLSSSRLPTVSAFKSSVTTIGNFALDQQCQIGALIAGHHKLLQWKEWVKLTDLSNEFAILKAVINQRKFDGTGVMLLSDWGDSADSPCWLAFEYLPRSLQACLAEDGAIQPWLGAAFSIQL